MEDLRRRQSELLNRQTPNVSRIVTLSSSMMLLELRNNMFKEFFANTQACPSASLSYWPPNTKELATGISTPPVMLTHDGYVSYFYRHFELHKGTNLFVTFNHQSDPINTSQVAENLFPFTTPKQPITKPPHLLNRFSGPRPPASGLSPPSTAASKIPGFSLFPDDYLLGGSPSKPSNTTTSPHSAPSKIRRFSLIDETVLCSDDILEEMFKEYSDNIPDSWKTEADEEEVIGPDSSLPPGFEKVQPRGYDHDFWEPFIEKHLGGSDAEQVMAGINVPKTAPHIIHSGDAFNHTVTPPGEQPTNWKPDPEDPTSHHHNFPHVYPNPMETPTPQSVPSTSTHHRKYPHGQPATFSAGVHPHKLLSNRGLGIIANFYFAVHCIFIANVVHVYINMIGHMGGTDLYTWTTIYLFKSPGISTMSSCELASTTPNKEAIDLHILLRNMHGTPPVL
ncbi:hypothetical protein F2Q69_00007690 [Brassica cretica]|uniref:Uncharacterized protein n=1 Tax=Brassica cretica TaxID=69181 RepID=A0A8S9P7U7_BRACR|nr:hypothetical protein F2Q69_00007690 [Brassica cretica]